MTLINYEGRKIVEGETVRLKAVNSEAMKVVTAEYEDDRLVLADADGTAVAVSPVCWCLVYPE